MNRQEAFDEYYKVAAFVQAYDGYFLAIKAWGVTVTAGAIAAGFSSGVASSRLSQVAVFVVAVLLACAFWTTEIMFKMLQLAHVRRASDLEGLLASGATEKDGGITMVSNTESKINTTVRVLCATLVASLTLSYISAVVMGAIPKSRRLDGPHIALLLCAALACIVVIRPQTLRRLSSLEGLGFRVELLQQLQERQVRQAEALYRLDLVVPLLFGEGERGHLEKLLTGDTKNYIGGGHVRDALRRLRAIGLLKSLSGRNVGDLHSDTRFDLADWVELTAFGRYWAERLRQIDHTAMVAELEAERSKQA
jgi:hypothetical protein